MVEQSASFHRIKYIKLHDNMAQIILSSKINCVGTSDEIQNHQKDTAQTKIAHCVGTSNEVQYHLTDSMPKEVRNCMATSNEIQYHHKTCTLDSPINSMATSNEIQYHPFYFGVNSSPPSSGNHRLLFIKAAELEEQEAGNGMRKGEESSTKWG